MSQPTPPLQARVFVDGPPKDSRKAFRYRPFSAAPMRLVLRPIFAPLRGLVSNLSTDGIGLLLYGRIDAGKRIGVQLGHRPHRRSRTLLADVIHCAPQEDGRWLVGCRLVHSLKEEEVIALLDNPGPEAGPPRRK